jgi:hypothetical protein
MIYFGKNPHKFKTPIIHHTLRQLSQQSNLDHITLVTCIVTLEKTRKEKIFQTFS